MFDRPSLKPLKQQAIVVTQAAHGVGLATARRAARAGACVFLIDTDERALRHLVEAIQRDGGRAAYAAADPADYDALSAAAQKCVRLFEGFTSWINIVGPVQTPVADDSGIDDAGAGEHAGYEGLVNGSLIAAEHLSRRKGGGAIVNVGPSLSDLPEPGWVAHEAAKAATKAFINDLRARLRRDDHPVSVSLIKPGPVLYPAGARRAGLPPQPVYAAEVVADAALWCAHHPITEITVGGTGRLIAMISAAAPEFAEPLLARFAPVARRGDDPAWDAEGLDGPDGEDTDEEMIYPMVRNFSALAEVRKHPGVTAGSLAVVVLAAAAAVLLTQRTGPRRYEAIRDRIDPRGWIDAETLRHRFSDISRGLGERAADLGDRASDLSDDARYGARKLLKRGQRAVSEKQRRKYAREARRYADEAGRYARDHAKEGGALLAVATIAAAIGAAALESQRPDSRVRRITGL
ncbi:SDR family NAD(P)-dependent oxidoreductase [Brevundimonas bacteroides]|uniref:SDR family NAD(P)-dependent oxidoreductase n=1 Tax=Brevundimonas bacteroides TaxID=74311 RepID=UPI000498378A|nr:SDR family NAD(P)-dependent oxidoreductase [Brevundimonas bacteroides]